MLCCTASQSSHILLSSILSFARCVQALLQSANVWVTLYFSGLLFRVLSTTCNTDSLFRNRPPQSCLPASYCTTSPRNLLAFPAESLYGVHIELPKRNRSRKHSAISWHISFCLPLHFPVSSFFSAMKWTAPAQKLLCCSNVKLLSMYWSKNLNTQAEYLSPICLYSHCRSWLSAINRRATLYSSPWGNSSPS